MELHIYNAIKKYNSARPVRFHMPGHKGGKFLGFNAGLDVTELDFIGNETAVKKAENDCAKILGADFLRFLSDGASAGIFASIYAVKDKGDKLIINRTAHKSVYNALKIFGIEPIIIGESVKDGLPKIITYEEVASALKENQSAIGVMLTYPDYYGRTFDIKGVSQVVKDAGKVFIVDNAHGNHYAFYGENDYAGKYADIYTDGVHKTNLTFNQGGIVCCKKEYADKLNEGVNVFSTTSPSYIILASVEYGIKYSKENGTKDFSRLNKKLNEIKKELSKINLKVIDSKDFLKLCIDIGGSGYDITHAKNLLEENRIFAELIDSRYVLFMFSSKTKNRELDKIVKTLKKLKDKSTKNAIELIQGERKVSYLTAINSNGEYTELSNSVGKVAGENFGVFPPCYPVCVAGEVITKSAIEYLKNKETFGVVNGKVKTLKTI